jgi:hypothetical protein
MEKLIHFIGSRNHDLPALLNFVSVLILKYPENSALDLELLFFCPIFDYKRDLLPRLWEQNQMDPFERANTSLFLIQLHRFCLIKQPFLFKKRARGHVVA